jgi:hypothetical protein
MAGQLLLLHIRPVHRMTDLLQLAPLQHAGVVAVDHWVKAQLSAGAAAGSAPGFLQGLIASAVSFLQSLLGVTVNADTGPLPFSAALAAGVWLVNGFVQARIAHPDHWLNDLRKLVVSAPLWGLYFAQLLADTFVSSLAALKGDPLVSYGFKQMYAGERPRVVHTLHIVCLMISCILVI